MQCQSSHLEIAYLHILRIRQVVEEKHSLFPPSMPSFIHQSQRPKQPLTQVYPSFLTRSAMDPCTWSQDDDGMMARHVLRSRALEQQGLPRSLAQQPAEASPTLEPAASGSLAPGPARRGTEEMLPQTCPFGPARASSWSRQSQP